MFTPKPCLLKRIHFAFFKLFGLIVFSLVTEHKIVRFLMQCNPTCGGFVRNIGASQKRLVVTHLKAPFEFRLIEMQVNI